MLSKLLPYDEDPDNVQSPNSGRPEDLTHIESSSLSSKTQFEATKIDASSWMEESTQQTRHGKKEWTAFYKDGKLHREDGPAFKSYFDGNFTREYWINGLLHCEDGPAFFDENGNYWFLKGWLVSLEEWCNILELTPTEKAFYILKYTK